MFKQLAIASVLGALSVSAAFADTTVNVDTQGWINSAGQGNGAASGNNTFTGNEFSQRFNSWASFDLSSLSGSFTGAILHVTPLNYPFGDPVSYNVSIYDVNLTSYASLTSNTAGLLGHLDLASGGLYGTADFTPGVGLSITLSPQALADINANVGGRFIIGFTNNTLNAQVSTPNVDLGVYTGGSSLELISAVPEPGSMAMLLAGLAVVGGVARRRSQAA